MRLTVQDKDGIIHTFDSASVESLVNGVFGGIEKMLTRGASILHVDFNRMVEAYSTPVSETSAPETLKEEENEQTDHESA